MKNRKRRKEKRQRPFSQENYWVSTTRVAKKSYWLRRLERRKTKIWRAC